MSKFGYIGHNLDEAAKLSGVFTIDEQKSLKDDGNWGNKIEVEILCIGGGGGGGGPRAGGGGAGGYRQLTVGMLTGIQYTVQVGGGGNGGAGVTHGTSGGNGHPSYVAAQME